MTTREKIIIGATVIAVGWAGFTFFLGSSKKESAGRWKAGQQVVDVQAFATQLRTQLACAKLNASEKSSLEAAQTLWDGEPFAESVGLASVPGKAAQSSFVYGGFVQSGNVRFAIINGREYRLNETLEDGSGVVDAIEPGQVVLRVGREGHPQVILFQQPILTRE